MLKASFSYFQSLKLKNSCLDRCDPCHDVKAVIYAVFLNRSALDSCFCKYIHKEGKLQNTFFFFAQFRGVGRSLYPVVCFFFYCSGQTCQLRFQHLFPLLYSLVKVVFLSAFFKPSFSIYALFGMKMA